MLTTQHSTVNVIDCTGEIDKKKKKQIPVANLGLSDEPVTPVEKPKPKRQVANTPSSRKAKSRRAQDAVAEDLQQLFNADKNDIKPTPMDIAGIDIQLSNTIRAIYPWGHEVKNQEKLSIWTALQQCESNANKERLKPCLVFKRNRTPLYAVVLWSDWLIVQQELLMLRNLVPDYRSPP